AVPAARAAGGAPRQHDAHRIAAVAQEKMGLRILHRCRGPCERSAAGEGAGLAGGAGKPVQGPRFLPASRALMGMGAPRTFLVGPSHRVAGALEVPGDKSISHRSLMLSGIAEGTSSIRGFLASEDCLASLAAMRALGVRIELPEPNEVRVHGVGM